VVLRYLRRLVQDEPAPDHEPPVHVLRRGESADAHAEHSHLHVIRRTGEAEPND
jgi:hypothetical protein